MTLNKKYEVAQLVHDKFLTALSSKCKHIQTLQYVELFVDNLTYDPPKIGWYGWVSVDLGCSKDMEDAYRGDIINWVPDLTEEQITCTVKMISYYRKQDFGFSINFPLTEYDMSTEEAKEVILIVKDMARAND